MRADDRDAEMSRFRDGELDVLVGTTVVEVGVDVPSFSEALRRCYAYTDTLIGLLLERYTAEDLVMVVSDHGFEGTPAVGGITGIHKTAAAREGVIFARGRGIRRGASTEGVRVVDVTPTLLTWLELPLARDMDGAPAGFLDTPSRPPIDTYDTTSIERVGETSAETEQRLIEELHELGYLESRDALEPR